MNHERLPENDFIKGLEHNFDSARVNSTEEHIVRMDRDSREAYGDECSRKIVKMDDFIAMLRNGVSAAEIDEESECSMYIGMPWDIFKTQVDRDLLERWETIIAGHYDDFKVIDESG